VILSLCSSQVSVDRLALHVLHDEVRNAFGRAAAVEQPGDIRMFQRGQNFALLAEPPQYLCVSRPRTEHFERNFLAEDIVVALCKIDHAHAAMADAMENQIRADVPALELPQVRIGLPREDRYGGPVEDGGILRASAASRRSTCSWRSGSPWHCASTNAWRSVGGGSEAASKTVLICCKRSGVMCAAFAPHPA
jgi:hypothetical protein